MLENLIANAPEYITVALAVVGGFAAIATITPNETDDKIVNILLKLINFLGANFGKAANDS
tara:strand:+ start:1931 stop:2113 length:183 start_codon:yes stop_codon:yes gene_type:complete